MKINVHFMKLEQCQLASMNYRHHHRAISPTVCVIDRCLPGLCSNALAFASANAAFALALAFDCHVMDAFAFYSFAFALAFDSNEFD